MNKLSTRHDRIGDSRSTPELLRGVFKRRRRKLRLEALGIWLGLEDSRLTIVQLSSACHRSFGGDLHFHEWNEWREKGLRLRLWL